MREAKFTKSLTVALPINDYQKIKKITDDDDLHGAMGSTGCKGCPGN